ncbi:MAG: glycosyltransferase, partial [Solirubrobacteraceae bacterium]
ISVLTQDYPDDRLSVVVVNDGSTDDTASVLADAFDSEPRVRVINQENAGFIAATNVALSHVEGDLIGILDADDAWKPGRLRCQVNILERHPEVGLVHGDMELVDAAGATLHPSYFAWTGLRPARGRVLGELMLGPNFVTASAILFRRCFLDQVRPVPREAVFPDWHFATTIAQYADIDHCDQSVSVYRLHGANMGLGGVGGKFYKDMSKNVNVQRRMLTQLRTDAVEISDLTRVVVKMRDQAVRAAGELSIGMTDVLAVSPADRIAAQLHRESAEAALAEGLQEKAGRELVLALAADPWDEGLLDTLRSLGVSSGSAALPALRQDVVLAFAQEVLDNPVLLARYGAAVTGHDDITLVIWSSAQDDQLVNSVAELTGACGLDGTGTADMVLYCSADLAAVLRAPSKAVLSTRPPRPALAGLPHVGSGTLDGLVVGGRLHVSRGATSV